VPLNGNRPFISMSLSSSFYPQRPQAQFDRCNRFKRALWSLVWLCLFRPSPRIAFAWRRGLLRLFGARLAATAQVYPSTRVWAPWNLAMHAHAVLGESVDCQSVGLIEIGADVAVSQYVHLCAASHAIDSPDHATTIGTIRLEPGCWVFAGAFIGPNVTVGRGAVVGARSVVVQSVPALQVVAGNPAKCIRQRAAEWALPSH